LTPPLPSPSSREKASSCRWLALSLFETSRPAGSLLLSFFFFPPLFRKWCFFLLFSPQWTFYSLLNDTSLCYFHLGIAPSCSSRNGAGRINFFPHSPPSLLCFFFFRALHLRPRFKSICCWVCSRRLTRISCIVKLTPWLAVYFPPLRSAVFLSEVGVRTVSPQLPGWERRVPLPERA